MKRTVPQNKTKQACTWVLTLNCQATQLENHYKAFLRLADQSDSSWGIFVSKVFQLWRQQWDQQLTDFGQSIKVFNLQGPLVYLWLSNQSHRCYHRCRCNFSACRNVLRLTSQPQIPKCAKLIYIWCTASVPSLCFERHANMKFDVFCRSNGSHVFTFSRNSFEEKLVEGSNRQIW